jgi:hypothetical protein
VVARLELAAVRRVSAFAVSRARNPREGNPTAPART